MKHLLRTLAYILSPPFERAPERDVMKEMQERQFEMFSRRKDVDWDGLALQNAILQSKRNAR